MSNGEGTGSKPKRGFAATKEKYENRIAELEAKLAEQDAREAEAVTVADLSSPPVTVPAEPKEPESEFLKVDCSRDCLAHITKDVQSVSIVSTFTGITIRRGERDMMPPLRRLQMKSSEARRWVSNPFAVGHQIVGPDPDGVQRGYDTLIKAQRTKWWHHRLTRARAEAIWQHPQMVKPTETALLPEQLKGFDSGVWQAMGDLQPIEEFVPLREAVRIILMRLEDTFMDWSNRDPRHEFDPRYPNPYRNFIRGLPKIPQLPEKARKDLASE